MRELIERTEALLKRTPVIPILTLNDAEKGPDLARALAAGGVPLIEVTLRTEAGLEAIRRIAAEVPGVSVGAGTILTAAQARAARDAGAAFLVSPGLTPALLDGMLETGLPLLPGVVTPSEVMAVLERGLRHLKFFPAEAHGGIATLKALAGPLPEARFCPTGGIERERVRDYLALPNVLAVGGSWVTPTDAIQRGDWARITGLAREAAATRPPV